MLRMKMIGVAENDNKPEPEDVDDFNKDTCEVCFYDVKNIVHSTENNVEVQELFEDDRLADSKDAAQDKVETFNEDTCNVCAYDF